jgi:hypothetical protein
MHRVIIPAFPKRTQAFLLLTLLCIVSSVAQSQSQFPDPDDVGAGHPTCLTPYLIQRFTHREKLDRHLLSLLDGLCSSSSDDQGRPIKQFDVLSSQRHFRIHFDTDGPDAVSKVDRNGNSIPDYIDSVAYYLEYAWHVEVDEYGYTAPPPDNRGPGPEIDAYICGIPPSFYGGAQPDFDNILGTNPVRISGYLILDNDYAGYPTSGIPGLRVTTAHEFQHIIQFSAYRAALAPLEPVSQTALYEATAVWFEQQVHPSIPDYRQYVDRFLESPQDYGFSTHNVTDNVTGYAHVLYLDYLAKKFGRDVVRNIWEVFRSKDAFDAINSVLAGENSNLGRSFCDFAQWSYYTGYRAKDTSRFPEAQSYPPLAPASVRTLDEDDITINGHLYPLSFGMYRVLLASSNPNVKDSVSFLVTDSRSKIGAGGPSIVQDTFQIIASRHRHADDTPVMVGDSTIYYSFMPVGKQPADSPFCLEVIGGTINVTIAHRSFPQPFLNTPGENLLIAVDYPDSIRSVDLKIYSSSMTRVAEVIQSGLQAQLGIEKLGVLWNGMDFRGDRVPSGIYFYELSVNGAKPVLGKFAVVSE